MKHAAIALLMLLGAGAMAQAADLSPQQKLGRTQQELQQTRSQQQSVKDQQAKLDNELATLRTRLINANNAADKSAAELDELEENLKDIEGTASRRNAQLAEQRTQLAESIALLQRLATTPPAAQLLSPTPPLDRLRTNIQLKTLLPEIERRTADVAATVADLRLLRQKLQSRRTAVEREQARYATQKEALNNLIGERDRLMAATRSRNKELEAKAAELAAQASDLRDLVERTERAKREGQEKEPEERQLVARALPASLNRRLPLSAPALVRFGQKDQFGTVTKGLILRPRPGATVASVAAGKIAFAGPFRGYGRVLIVEHSGEYHTVLAGLGRIMAEVGQQVAAGEPLGQMAEASDPPPELYFEVRRDGTPVDPLGDVAARLTRN